MSTPQHQTIATLFRPMIFKDVIGQDHAVSALKKISKADGIVCSSIFLKGSHGSGKTTLSRIFAKAMNCENFKKTGEVCNECAGCKEVESKTSQLYHEFDTSVVGNVENMKAIIERLQVIPQGRRVVVFDEIHQASKAALTSLLKPLEEGLPGTVIVFASTDDILPTIKSRSLCIDINLIPLELIKQRVKEVATARGTQITDEQLTTLAMKANGHMRDALSVLQLFELTGEEALSTSYTLIKTFIIASFSKDQKYDAQKYIPEILKYNIVDIRNSIKTFIRSLYISEQDTPENKLLKVGAANSIFEFFYKPVAQQALQDEVGVEILLRDFLNKRLSK